MASTSRKRGKVKKTKDGFTRLCESVGLDEKRFEAESRRIEKERKPISEISILSSPDLPELLDSFSKIPPETVWQWMFQSMPEMMKRVDLMLLTGHSPEWISMRGEFLEMPVELQTGFINALHWRQLDLRKKLTERIFKKF